MAGFDVQRIIAAYQAGQQVKQQREQAARDAEDRKFEIERRNLELKKLKLDEKMAARNEDLQRLDISQGQLAPEATVGMAPMQPMPIPGGQTPAPIIPEGTRTFEGKLAPVTVRGVHGPDVTVQPQSMQEMLRAQEAERQRAAAAKAAEPFTLTPGQRRFSGSTEIASVPEEAPAIIQELQAFSPNFAQLDDAGKLKVLSEYVAAKQAPRNIDPLSPEGIAAKLATEKPEFEWIVRDGQPLQIQKGTAKPGDRPYDSTTAKEQVAAGPSAYATERAARTVQSVNELLGKVNRWTTGAGSLLSVIPESDARNFQAELDTLKANIAFNELTAMREASKTGGALGQVSNIELGLLQSALGALDTRQSPENLRTQLLKIRGSVERWQKAQAKNALVQPGTVEDGYVFQGGDPADPKNWKKQ